MSHLVYALIDVIPGLIDAIIDACHEDEDGAEALARIRTILADAESSCEAAMADHWRIVKGD